MIPVHKKDYLEQDPTIRGQNFACLSFISPEEVLKRKESFYFEKYVSTFSQKINELITGLEASFPAESDKIRSIKEEYEYILDTTKINDAYTAYASDNSADLNKEFDSENEFQTSIRGIKIRGVYESLQEAQARCEQLRKLDNDKFNIYVSEVGCWCPWSPNPNDVKDQQYALDSLNTLIHEYEKNVEDKDSHFAQRKADLQERLEENEKKKAEMRESETPEESDVPDTMQDALFEKPDPFLSREA